MRSVAVGDDLPSHLVLEAETVSPDLVKMFVLCSTGDVARAFYTEGSLRAQFVCCGCRADLKRPTFEVQGP